MWTGHVWAVRASPSSLGWLDGATEVSTHLGIPQCAAEPSAQRAAQEVALLRKMEALRGALCDGELPLELRTWLWRTVAVPRLAWMLGSTVQLSGAYLRAQSTGLGKPVAGVHWINRQVLPGSNLMAPLDGLVPGAGLTPLDHVAAVAVIHRAMLAARCLQTCVEATEEDTGTSLTTTPGHSTWKEGWQEACKGMADLIQASAAEFQDTHGVIQPKHARASATPRTWGDALAEALAMCGAQVRLMGTPGSLQQQSEEDTSRSGGSQGVTVLQANVAGQRACRGITAWLHWADSSISALVAPPHSPWDGPVATHLPMISREDRQRTELEAAREWATRAGAQCVWEASQVPDAEVVAAAMAGSIQAITQLRLQARSLGGQHAPPDSAAASRPRHALRPPCELVWLMPAGAAEPERWWLGVSWAAAHATLAQRAGLRATAEAAGRMPGVRRVRWRRAAAAAAAPTGATDEQHRPMGEAGAIRQAREAELAVVARVLQREAGRGAACRQPRVCHMALARGDWGRLRGAHSNILRAAGRVPAVAMDGHHHAPHHYADRCRLCSEAGAGSAGWPGGIRDDWEHALGCPAPRPLAAGAAASTAVEASAQPGRQADTLKTIALCTVAEHFTWRGQLAPVMQGTTERPAMLQWHPAQRRAADSSLPSRRAWPCPPWAQPGLSVGRQQSQQSQEMKRKVGWRWVAQDEVAQRHRCLDSEFDCFDCTTRGPELKRKAVRRKNAEMNCCEMQKSRNDWLRILILLQATP